MKDKVDKKHSSEDDAQGYLLLQTPVSFYDSFDIVDGVPAYHLGKTRVPIIPRGESSRCREMTSELSWNQSSSSRKQYPVRGTSVGDEPHITASAFNEDGTRLVLCYNSGEVFIWDTNHGELLDRRDACVDCQILAVTFVERSKTNVHMVTRDGEYLKLDVEQKTIERRTISETWTSMKLPNKQIELQTVDFCHNGSFLVCSLISDSDRHCQMEVFIANIAPFPSIQNVINLSVVINPGSIVYGVEMSLDAAGIIVGTSDGNMEVGKCFLWPLFTNSNEHWELNPGTLGTWSANSELVVTWTAQDGPNPEANNGSSVFIWNVKDLRKKIERNETGFPFDPTMLRSPFGENVLWCRLVSDSEGNDRLIMAIIGTTTRFLFWDVESGNHTHTIETGILTGDMMLASTQAWIDSRVNKMSIRGLNPMAVTADRSKFGAVLGCPCRVLIYDAQLGVQLLKLNTQISELGGLGNKVDIMFSSKNGKIAAIGAHSVMMFAPPTSSRIPQHKGSTMETSMIELDNSKDRSNDSGRCKLAFSGDGKTLGVLTIGSYEMQVYHLETDSITPIKTNRNLGEEIMDFCLSMDGRSIVTSVKNGYTFVSRCLHGGRVDVGTVSANLDPIALGISPDAKEIVVCSLEGALIWLTLFEFDSQAERKDFLSAPSAKQKNFLSSMMLRPRNVLGEGSTNGLLNHANTMSSNRDLNRERRGFTYNPYYERLGFGVISCRISADCSTAVRLLAHREIEIWALKEKRKVQTLPFVFPNTLKLENQDLLPLSGHVPCLELLGSKSEETEILSIDQGTTILPENEGFLVTDSVDLTLRSLLSEVKAEWFPSENKAYEDLDSLYIINTSSPQHSRRLRGRQLKPQKGLAVSSDGRHVACLSGKYASKIVLWNIYASEDLLPDYHSLSLLYSIKNKSVVTMNIKNQLSSFGANFFNFKHASGLTLLTEATLNLNKPLLEIILEYGYHNEVKVSFLMRRNDKCKDPLCSYHNTVEACLYKRSPEIVKIIMHYLLKRLSHEAELDSLLTRSLTDVQCSYSPIFESSIRNTALFKTVCRLEAPSDLFTGEEFLTMMSPSLNLTEYAMKESWNKKFATLSKTDSVNLTATAMTLLYKDACQIGEDGLLRELLLNEAQFSAFGSFALKAIVNFKWKAYAKDFVIQELCHHCLIAFVFTVYCFLLREEDTYQMDHTIRDPTNTLQLNCTSSDGESNSPVNCTGAYDIGNQVNYNGGDEEMSLSVVVTLIICWILAVPCLLRELNQCWAYTARHQLRGFVYWLKSGWNWMEVLSYFNIVVVIPLAHFVFANEGSYTTTLSALVALESLLLWSRMLFYARPFRATGPFVLVIASLTAKIIPLMVLGLTVMIGFALAFHVLYRHVREIHDEDEDNEFLSMHKSFRTFGSTMYTLFGYLFGEFEADDVHHAPHEVAAMTLFVLYMVAMSVILMNMVIALLSEWFGCILKSKDSRFNEARAKAIDDIDSMLSSKRKGLLRKKNAGYLHVLVPTFHRKRIMKGPTFIEAEGASIQDVDALSSSDTMSPRLS
eukprot:g6298.t1